MTQLINAYQNKTTYAFTDGDWQYLSERGDFIRQNLPLLVKQTHKRLADPGIFLRTVEVHVSCWLTRALDGGEKRIWQAFQDSVDALLDTKNNKKTPSDANTKETKANIKETKPCYRLFGCCK